MVSEPLYHFVKGKGWVTGPEGFEMVDCRVLLTVKKPEIGDYTIYCTTNRRTWINPDGTLVEEQWKNWVSQYSFHSVFTQWPGGPLHDYLTYIVVTRL